MGFLVCLFTVFLDCRSTKLLRLFSGNLPAFFLIFGLIMNCELMHFKMSRDSPDRFIYQAIALPFSRSRVAFLLLGNPDVWFC